ncbi:lipid-A-disaccharide synthase [Alloacidobacterium sp.]|uniref:lipid-A-disaccharide synthase n=1 Tax=Alloacidobacterium sp. TaxID=2951999 RepID=UPI002D59829A|nr:lipid-A-disaccharide synthase [Alloacidobacterium sp.]HYK35740.1 lipid-A-disaccharide synthase [Alloacidobacterium sp.]
MDRAPDQRKVFISAGEASGEHYAAQLIPAIRKLAPGIEFFGLGGQRMEALGFRRIVRAEDVAVMGITEIIRHVPRIYGEYRKLKASIAKERPHAAILIDFPDVNLSLARTIHKLGIPVIYFVSPQLWAWKKYRIRRVRRYVDRMLVIFPFEEAFYREHGVNAIFVGHPLAEVSLPSISRKDFADQYHLDPSKQWVGLLPGSRFKEIRLNLPEMIEAAIQLNEPAEFLLPLAPTLTPEHVNQISAMLPASGPRITPVNDARAALHHARSSVVASGTATVEAALIGNPFLVVYRVSRLTYSVARRAVKVPHVAMVNLIAGCEVVPELIQSDFTAQNVVLRLRDLLHDEAARARMQADLTQVSASLHADRSPIEQAAGITVELMGQAR